jgi:signal transduction histidine kinase
MFEMFADVIAHHLNAIDEVKSAEATLYGERRNAALREQFIAVLGHDLRNPLAAIDGGMRLLLKTPLNDQATKIVGMVQNSVKRMAELIGNVTDFARGRLGGGVTLNLAAEPMEPMLRQVVAELQTTAPERLIETSLALTGPVKCDRVRLGQLVSNLLANALAYGAPDKPVRLEAATRDGKFELAVINGGEPIPPAALGSIFEPFTRGAYRPNQQGLGLGLYIAHEIAKAHGGTLEVKSTPAETRFTFRMALNM